LKYFEKFVEKVVGLCYNRIMKSNTSVNKSSFKKDGHQHTWTAITQVYLDRCVILGCRLVFKDTGYEKRI